MRAMPRKARALCALAPSGRTDYATASLPRPSLVWSIVSGHVLTRISTGQTSLPEDKNACELSHPVTGSYTSREVEHSTSGTGSMSNHPPGWAGSKLFALGANSSSIREATS